MKVCVVKRYESMLKDRVEIQKCTLTENITSAILSGFGAMLGVATIVLCVINAVARGEVIDIITSSILGGAIFLFFMMDIMYHSLTVDCAKRVFLILSTCMVHFAILGVNSVYALKVVNGALGWTMFGVSAVVSIVSIVFCAINLKRFDFMSFALAITNLWLLIPLANILISGLGLEGFVLYFISQSVCTFASLFYVLGKKFNNMHIIFHILILVGIALQFLTVCFYAIEK
jgi:hemolysin III